MVSIKRILPPHNFNKAEYENRLAYSEHFRTTEEMADLASALEKLQLSAACAGDDQGSDEQDGGSGKEDRRQYGSGHGDEGGPDR